MSGLSMKKFGEQEGSSSDGLDFSSLEVNPKFKAEGSGTQDEGSASSSQETTGKQQEINNTGVASTAATENTGGEQAPKGSENTNTEVKQSEDKTIVNTDLGEDVIFKQLSEKLGREIKSYDDLKPSEQTAVELDPQVKLINEWKEKTGRPVEDFFKFQKDYTQVSDADVAREFLQLEYPTFTREEINLELENLLPSEDDLDSEAAKKSLELKKYAIKGRKALEALKQDLGTPSTNSLTPEIKQKLEFADKVQSQITANEAMQADYNKQIEQASLSNSAMKLNLDDSLSIDFKIPDEDRKTLPTLLNEMPHWRKEDGSWNHQAVVEDAIKIKYFDSMIRLAYEQGLNSGKDDILKQAKNTTLGNPNTESSEQGTGSKKPIIEDIDKILGKQKLSMKYNR